jgi:hypothetical protein
MTLVAVFLAFLATTPAFAQVAPGVGVRATRYDIGGLVPPRYECRLRVF